VLSDVLPLEGVPTGVTRVANICALKYHLYFLHVRIPQLWVYVCNDRFLWLKDVGIRLYLEKKNLTHTFCQGKCSDTTCNMTNIKCMQNINKILEMAK
jgi:hypothetical protein